MRTNQYDFEKVMENPILLYDPTTNDCQDILVL